MIGSESVLKIVMGATVLASVMASGKLFLEAAIALRAKKRAQRYVRERTKVDTNLASIRQHAVTLQPLSPEEIEAAMKSIEVAISSMSEADKKLIKEGLHQEDSPRGTKRYVNELLKWAPK